MQHRNVPFGRAAAPVFLSPKEAELLPSPGMAALGVAEADTAAMTAPLSESFKKKKKKKAPPPVEVGGE